MTVIGGDVELNPKKSQDGAFRTDRKPVPSEVPTFEQAKPYLTKNVPKADDFVNGMKAVVEGLNEAQQCLRPQTETGHRPSNAPWHESRETECGGLSSDAGVREYHS